MRSLTVAVAGLLLAGCATEIYRVNRTAFEPTSPTTFEYRAGMGASESEELRLRILADYLERNRLCPNGYRIVERTPVISDTGPLIGEFGTVYYKGECKSA